MKLKLTQDELASLLNVAQSTVHRWDTGKSTPNLDECVRIRELAERRGVVDWDNNWFFEVPADAVTGAVPEGDE